MSQLQSTRKVTIQNKQGLHFRPADMLAKLANEFESDIQIENNGVTVNGKSFLDIVTLVAVQGTELTFLATGEDAEKALQSIADLLENYKDHDEEVADSAEESESNS